MFGTYSMAGTGTAIVLIETVLRLFGIDFPDGSVAEAVNGLVSLVGFVLLVWGQLRRKDLRWGFWRRSG